MVFVLLTMRYNLFRFQQQCSFAYCSEKQREKFGKEPVIFDYLLLCNKICGASHYNMQMSIIVESEKDYNEWLAKQKPFKAVASK